VASIPQTRSGWRSAISLFARLSPAAKLIAWGGLLAGLIVLLELLAVVTSLDVSILNKNGGSAVLMILALVGLLAIVAYEQKPLAECGLVIDRLWVGKAVLGAVVGLGVYSAYLAVGVALGAVDIDTSNIDIASAAEAMLALAFAFPPAAVQQIIFAGLLIGLLRPQLGTTGAVATSSAMFGVAVAAGHEQGLLAMGAWRLALGMCLLAGLLGLLRLASGSVVMSSGALAGALAVRRVTSKLELMVVDLDHPLAQWLAPEGDPRQAPLFWAVLAAAGVATAAWLAVRGEARLVTDKAADAHFKRLNPFSNLLTFVSLERWLVLLVQARLRVGLMYVPRLVITLIGSAIGTVLAWPERLLAPLLLRHRVEPPVFVVGIHRSGTTHLHNMLALDPQFRAPRNYEVFNPLGFITGWITTALMTPALMWRRPMDAVQMTPLSSQEEEFALAAMGSPSPYMAFCLPGEFRRHWRYMHAEGFDASERRRWQRDYRLFLRKLTWWCRRRPLLKNPANTGRIGMLRDMFPAAKFIYLVRHPDAVYRSNKHFASHGLVVFQLQDPSDECNYTSEFLDNYRRVSAAARRDMESLADDQAVRIRFEDLEENPIATIEHIYGQLGLSMSFAFRQRLADYVERNAGYRKNRQTPLPDGEAAAVRAAMGDYFAEWGYDQPAGSRQAA
jgi:hypothetical protein